MTQLETPAVQPSTGAPLTADERDELLRLRRELESIRNGRRPRRPFRWRSLSATVLIVLGCVLAPVAGVSVWVNNQVSDTDRFVRTMSPLVDDPDVQSRLTDRLTATVFEYVDVQRIADDAVDALAAQGLPPQLADRLGTLTPTLASAVTGFVHDRIAELVASPAFATAWNQAIRVVHRQAVSVLSGDGEGVVIRGDMVLLDLAPFIDLVKERLSDAGLTAVSLVPEVHPTVELAKADTLVSAQTAYSTLDSVARVLPWIVLLLLAVGIYLARNRFRALVGSGLGIALSMVVLGAGLLVARSLLTGAVPPGAAPATASGFDIVVTYLRLGLRTLLVLGLVLALAGFLAGRSDSAVRIRRSVAGRLHGIRGGPAVTGPVPTFVRTHLRGLRIGAVAVAVLTFVFMEQPTGVTILVIAALLLVVLALIEFLGRPGDVPPSEAEGSVPADDVAGPPPAIVVPPAPRGGGAQDVVSR
ncbi:hypothetical protein E4P40_00835 [Blastococcus sp. CT_GayMR20]|uniref:hypothetical protein n=1 Tax=Blastococcus sp. CT_GayMR20 TaxID=2559609 RepID=UPI00107426A9|nr:hypothetical protein [Blastococcus sp. CT_GayMR20]TFV92964.1 hypothetical protein E4P40_00835 [Blastococcus sp. CT_GayMR20]